MTLQVKNISDRRESQLDDDFIREDLEQMLKATNYLNYQYRIVEPYLGNRVLEIGSGIGAFTQKLLHHREFVIAVEPNNYCFNQLRVKFQKQRNLLLKNVPIDQYPKNEFAKYHIDTILCMNVLEHIENDIDAITIFYNALTLGGKLILVVPAHEWAFGAIDQAVGHFRRYSCKHLRSIVENAGFTSSFCYHFNPVGIAGWLWNAKCRKLKKQSDRQIFFFDKYIVPLQSLLERFIQLPFGQSLLLVAQKNRIG